MNIRRLVGLLVIAPGFVSCIQDADDGYAYGMASVESVQVLSVTRTDVEFLVRGWLPSPCWEHVNTVVTRERPRRYTVSLAGRIRSDAVCIQSLGLFERVVTVHVLEPGEIEFRFPQGETGPVVVVAQVR
ncbi:hypothetical protein K8I85_15755 [bacterium]|nr:hypothetical protein [bacterium]